MLDVTLKNVRKIGNLLINLKIAKNMEIIKKS